MTLQAALHDGNPIAIEVSGAGPNILLPVNPHSVEGPQADEMRKWGADPALGHSLVNGLNDSYRVIAFDYDTHNLSHPKPNTLTPDNVVRDILAVADAAGADRFAYYGYSWLGMIGLQLALRTDRLSALVMGGFPPLDGPYVELLPFFEAVHAQSGAQLKEGEQNDPKDLDNVKVTVPEDTTRQFVTLFRALQDFDDAAAQSRIKCPRLPRLCFVGSEDRIDHGAKWGDVHVSLAAPMMNRRNELERLGWEVRVLEGLNHVQAMQASQVVPLIRSCLASARP
jgi:pimeloyl-ACP methyl ester carboxylesterase